MASGDLEHPVVDLHGEELGKRLTASVDAVRSLFPADAGVAVFVFDFGPGGGLAYASNADRADMVKVLEEFIRRQRNLA